MFIFEQAVHRQCTYYLQRIPNQIEYRCGEPSRAHFENDVIFNIGCLGCINPRCMYFDSSEIVCNQLADFAYDHSTQTCPIGAIKWDANNEVPVINNEKCIKCGICINRCPVGAIYFDRTIKVHTVHSAIETMVVPSAENISIQEEQIALCKAVERSNSTIIESNDLFHSIYNKLSLKNGRFIRIFIRNLLISLGCNSTIPRIGDVYTRMDVVYSLENDIGVAEVEFGTDSLSTSRRLLDDIAVLHSRYGVNRNIIHPLAIYLNLPTRRQDYWQVVKDIMRVENILINTISVGSLLILNWNRKKLLVSDNGYYLDYDNTNLRNLLSEQIDREIQIDNGYLGILEPER